MKKIFFLMSLAFLAISCTDQPDYVMSLTESEQLEVMQGTWKLTRASNSSAVYDENDELHLQNDLETGLNTLEITENSVVMHFDEPISLYESDEMGAGWELVRTDDTFEFHHNVFSIPDITFASMEGREVLVLGIAEGIFEFYTKDDYTSDRMILNFNANYYFEFERVK